MSVKDVLVFGAGALSGLFIDELSWYAEV